MRRHTVVPTLLAVLTCSACSSAGGSPDRTAAEALPDGRLLVQAGPAQVRAEVADDPEERAVGLMRRTEVPPGTGMVFLYDAPSTGGYYMYDVPVPLTAVFGRDGRVVGVVPMPPCQERRPQACPTYGPGTSYDTVLEAAPETLREVAVGDPLVVRDDPRA